jgi:hypothetical protein
MSEGHSTGLQLLLEDPLLLQDLVADEKNRELNDPIDLEPPTGPQTLRVFGCHRFKLVHVVGMIQIRVKESSAVPTVLLTKLDAAHHISSSTNLKNVKNLAGIPSYDTELLTGKEQHTADYSTGFILLAYMYTTKV